MKRTQMPQRDPARQLVTRTPLARTVPLDPGTGKIAARRTAGTASGKPADRNSGPTPKVRRLVLERDGYACVCCGQSVIGQRYSLAHRLRAAHGGRPVASNLIVLLGWGGEQHHGRVDLYKDPADEAKGYRLRSGRDPKAEPVLLFSEHGSGITVWLDDAGNYLFDAPEASAA